MSVVELRHYTLHPGRRETLIELFEREFVAPQEAAGMTVLAQFRDLDRPDAFTWLRGFPDLASRAARLAAFYDGPVWAAHRDAANATMIDSDDVRLLRPVRPGIFAVDGAGARPGLVVATIHTLRAECAAAFADFFARDVEPCLAACGMRPVAVYETEPGPNDFPRLPVREGEHAFVWLACYPDVVAHERAAAALAADPAWTEGVLPALERACRAPALVWRLVPTARSRVPQSLPR